ncbi:Plipastatin synthase subunit B [Chromobacterium violaceum]|uniref:Plipastatin synthase subunit B n=1 Tax=Chromobacterium violaceum TaxID=536 RepID=A0A3S4HKN0_CHRVL|nr:Plipastatin synthase subunit B [Chromobacterium violaceum]
MDAAIVDAGLRPVAKGEEGELCLLGDALAIGYLGRDELTARRFVSLDALPGAPRAYRTATARSGAAASCASSAGWTRS